ncbi:MAG: hypothetical protein AAGE52_39065 [Myxococcota bacterium]
MTSPIIGLHFAQNTDRPSEVASWLSDGTLVIRELKPSGTETRFDLSHFVGDPWDANESIYGLALSDDHLLIQFGSRIVLLDRDRYQVRWTQEGKWWNGLTLRRGLVLYHRPTEDYLGECLALDCNTKQVRMREPGKIIAAGRDHVFVRERSLNHSRVRKFDLRSMECVVETPIERRAKVQPSHDGRLTLVSIPGALSLVDEVGERVVAPIELDSKTWASWPDQLLWSEGHGHFAARWNAEVAVYNLATSRWSRSHALQDPEEPVNLVCLSDRYLVVAHLEAERIFPLNPELSGWQDARERSGAAYIATDETVWQWRKDGTWSAFVPTPVHR